MNRHKQVEALAEIDGYTKTASNGITIWLKDGYASATRAALPNYLYSGSAVSQLYRGLTHEMQVKTILALVLRVFDEKLGSAEVAPSDVLAPIELTALLFNAHPKEFCEAIIVAHNKWKGESCEKA